MSGLGLSNPQVGESHDAVSARGGNASPISYALERKMRSHSGAVLALDPGETTGWSYFVNGVFTQCGQILPQNKKADLLKLKTLLSWANRAPKPLTVVIERFRLYAWKAAQQVNSTFPTVEVIGVVRLWCQEYPSIQLVEQSASQAKTFVTDQRLRDLNLWIKGRRHSRDSIRHAVYYLVCGRTNSKAQATC